jgi:hypothetical protein
MGFDVVSSTLEHDLGFGLRLRGIFGQEVQLAVTVHVVKRYLRSEISLA